jgi:GcrA cell cycle regulator
MEWTADRIALLKRLRGDGVSYAAIAAKLGISRGAVSGKVDRLGLAAPAPAPRGPRPPRARLKMRRGIGPAGPAPRLGDGASGPAILRDALLQSASRDKGSRDVPCSKGQQANTPAAASARTPHACSLLDLTEDTCRWPVGDVGEPGFFFCGQPPLKGAPYCGPHCRKAFLPLDAQPMSEFAPDRDAARVLQPDTRFGQFAHWDVT